MTALLAAALVGMLVEALILRRLYKKEHVEQVLATFGLMFIMQGVILLVFGGQYFSYNFLLMF